MLEEGQVLETHYAAVADADVIEYRILRFCRRG